MFVYVWDCGWRLRGGAQGLGLDLYRGEGGLTGGGGCWKGDAVAGGMLAAVNELST